MSRSGPSALGMVADPSNAQEVDQAIRLYIGKEFGSGASQTARIQYGGSVTAKNASQLISQPDVDGFLVGGASLDVDEFARIVRPAAKR